MDNWTTPKYNSDATRDSPQRQPKIYTLHSSVYKGGQNEKSGRIFCVGQVDF